MKQYEGIVIGGIKEDWRPGRLTVSQPDKLLSAKPSKGENACD